MGERGEATGVRVGVGGGRRVLLAVLAAFLVVVAAVAVGEWGARSRMGEHVTSQVDGRDVVATGRTARAATLEGERGESLPLPAGAPVRILESAGGRHLVVTEGGARGWLRAADVVRR
jgi:hypothetical protein